ncbi:major facilitator superfamily domain-containing protein 6-like [Elysia marginata]|uniref:Major facilitator superfamily domain-containing protein 6-like n=1 Tax=Elysia marginata TaxID=1093978 RepID=A0AAV4FJH1_9GAST|nr:major facilitator superfamily domain-containing protein 6-like [Elysia marginata]
MKSLNLTAAETGVVTGASVLAGAFLRTGIGVAADKMAARKAFLMITCTGFGTAFFFLWFVPPRTDLVSPPGNAVINTSDLGDLKFPRGKNQTPQHWACFSSNGSQLCRFPSKSDTQCQLVKKGDTLFLRRVRRKAVNLPEFPFTLLLDTVTSNNFSLLNIRNKRSHAFSKQSSHPSPHQLQDNKANKERDKSGYLSDPDKIGTPCFTIENKMSTSSYTFFNRKGSDETSRAGESKKGSRMGASLVSNELPAICLPDCRPIFSSESSSSAAAEASSRPLLHIVTESVNLTSNRGITFPVLKGHKGIQTNLNVFRADSAFFVSLILVTTARAFYSSATSLADAVTYTILGPRSLKWGRQRMWGTVGTAIAVLSATNINDHLKGNSFAALFFACLGLSFMATLVGGVSLRADKSPKLSNLRSDVSRLLSEAAVRVFLLKLSVYGIMCGTAQNFFLWFLVDLGSNQTTLGLCVVVHCLSSVLTLRFSSRIFKLISHNTVIRVVLATYVVRFLVFSFLTRAWAALPIELLHGVTYSLMWAAVSSTASQMALPGTQASCQAIAGAAYWDLGRGVGNLLTGQLMQIMGARWTFRTYAVACALLLPLFWLLDRTWPISRPHVLPVATFDEDPGEDSCDDKGDGTLDQRPPDYEKGLTAELVNSLNSSCSEGLQQSLSERADPGQPLSTRDKSSVPEPLSSFNASRSSQGFPNSTTNEHAQPNG